ncbi:hypothetical protein [Sphingomonas bacterium]|uniref:hypothetical protein n=1 Tax=Sphingomonas bacterium TaxID=1895847 RepID=UPI002603070B|nr:hypothetical protein [Sphingomonas bacterium]
MAAICGVQGKMMADLDSLAGVQTGSVAHYAKLAGVALARSGGMALFRLGVAQLLKIWPGAGDLAAAALSGGVAAGITQALGHAYWLGAKHLARSGETIGEADFSAEFERAMAMPPPTATAQAAA